MDPSSPSDGAHADPMVAIRKAEVMIGSGPPADLDATVTGRVVDVLASMFRGIVSDDKWAQKQARVAAFRAFRDSALYPMYCTLPRPLRRPIRLVVFDKDGTLVRLGQLFGPWVEALVAALTPVVPQRSGDRTVWHVLGYDPVSHAFEPTSIVACGTFDDIRTALCHWTLEVAPDDRSFDKVWRQVEGHWVHPALTEKDLHPCGALTALFAALVARGIATAVCTSDDRAPTLQTLEWLGLKPAIVLCGDDPTSFKPSPEPLWAACAATGVPPSSAVMVGDTRADLLAGRHAKFGHVVGVLTGGCSAADLHEADVVLDSVDDLLSLPIFADE